MRKNWIDRIIEEVERKEDVRQIEDQLPTNVEGFYIGGQLVFDPRASRMEDNNEDGN